MFLFLDALFRIGGKFKLRYLDEYIIAERFLVLAAKRLVLSTNCIWKEKLKIQFAIKWCHFWVKKRKNGESRKILGQVKIPSKPTPVNYLMRENRFIVLL